MIWELEHQRKYWPSGEELAKVDKRSREVLLDSLRSRPCDTGWDAEIKSAIARLVAVERAA